MSDEIPFHIQVEIIKRLHVVSLLQFRSVSKTWKSLIDSSDFIAAHNINQPQHLLLSYQLPPEKYISYVDNDTFPEKRFVHTLSQSLILLQKSTIIGCSLGLLCLHVYYGDPEAFSINWDAERVVLWNPSIRKSIVVVVPNNNNNNPDHKTTFGFAVCLVQCDPKIVKIIQVINNFSYHCQAEVYSVSSGKWKSLSNNLPSKPFQVFWPQVAVDRFIYWCVFDPMTMDSGLPYHNLIMPFDTIDETFEVVDLPSSLSHLSFTNVGISKLRESLVILEYDSMVETRACVVWMMEINGVQKSFTKLFPVEAPYWPLGKHDKNTGI